MIYLLRIHRMWYCPVGTGTLPKLQAKAKEKREKYPGLYLPLNFPFPTRTAIGQAWLEDKSRKLEKHRLQRLGL